MLKDPLNNKKIKLNENKILNLSVQSKKELEVHTKIYKKFLKQGNFVLGPSVDKFESKISRIVKKNIQLVAVQEQMPFILH